MWHELISKSDTVVAEMASGVVKFCAVHPILVAGSLVPILLALCIVQVQAAEARRATAGSAPSRPIRLTR